MLLKRCRKRTTSKHCVRVFPVRIDHVVTLHDFLTTLSGGWIGMTTRRR